MANSIFYLSDSVKLNYKLKRPIIDQFESFVTSIKSTNHYINDMDALQWFLRKNGVYGFILYFRFTNGHEIRVTMAVEKHRKKLNRQNLNKLNEQGEVISIR